MGRGDMKVIKQWLRNWLGVCGGVVPVVKLDSDELNMLVLRHRADVDFDDLSEIADAVAGTLENTCVMWIPEGVDIHAVVKGARRLI
jgi:hypothetical protein